MTQLNKPAPLKPGDCIGIFTPSWPGNVILHEKYEHGKRQLAELGFEVIEGDLTKRMISEGYRAGTIHERASEFNTLYKNTKVKALVSTIGGYCSSSIIPYLDYAYIRKNPKIVCGYSDITAIHLALNALGNLTSFYGPAIVPSFGEYPSIPDYTLQSWLIQTGVKTERLPYYISPPTEYSNEFIDATKENWKSIKRFYKKNTGWKIINEGTVKAPARAYNLNTLLSLAGTNVWPDLKGKILFIEQMNVLMSVEERSLNQLKLIGTFDEIAALVISKPENNLNPEGASFSYAELLCEVIGKDPGYPIIENFDCGHTIPMLTIPQDVLFEIECRDGTVSLMQHEMGFDTELR